MKFKLAGLQAGLAELILTKATVERGRKEKAMSHTTGPWTADADGTIAGPYRHPAFGSLDYWPLARVECRGPEENAANGRLIAAAPDHALIARLMIENRMIENRMAWIPYFPAGHADGTGHIFYNGERFATKLDEFGVPIVTARLRLAIRRAEAIQAVAEAEAERER